MVKGIFLAITACFIWGMIFIIPEYMKDFSPIEIAFGRYLFYGILAFVLFLKERALGKCKYPKIVWLKMLLFSLVCTHCYYIFVILSVRLSGAAICALVLGITPITIAFYGNLKNKEIDYKKLIIPSLLFLFGLLAINASHLKKSVQGEYFWGILCSLIALISWSWYVVANVQFLKKYEVKPIDWSTLIGIGALFWTTIFGVLFYYAGGEINFAKLNPTHGLLPQFFIGCTLLGFFCSWIGSVLWNRASLFLPVPLAGHLMIFETIFGVIFAYLIKKNTPPFLECIGIVLFFIAIVYGMQIFKTKRVLEEL